MRWCCRRGASRTWSATRLPPSGSRRSRRTRHLMRAVVSCAVLAGTILTAAPALAFTVSVTHAGPSVVGEAHAFTATVTGASGALTYEWTFGDAAPEIGGA